MYSSGQQSILQFTFFVVVFCSMISCGGPQQPNTEIKETTHTTIVFDTVQKARIDSLVETINSGLNATGGPSKIPYPLYSQNDTLYYWEVQDQSARISIEWNLPIEIVWPTFFIYKGELVFVRYRYARNDPPSNSSVFESMIYLDKGVIIYCEERGQPLSEGETPGLLRELEYNRSPRTYGAIEDDYKNHWKTVRAFMKEHNVLPAYIKG